MAARLTAATEALIEAALREASAEVSGASKDTVAELRHIHGTADKIHSKLEQVLEAKLDAKLDAVTTAITSQTRLMCLHAAIDRLYSNYDGFTYYEQNDGYYGNTRDAKDFTKSVLKNALRGNGTWLPECAVCEDSSTKDGYGRPSKTQQAFNTQYTNYLHSLTGLKPRLEASTDSKKYVVYL